MRQLRSVLAGWLCCVVGCSGGGGGPAPVPDAAAPQVTLAFPPANAVTDQATLLVDGEASDDVAVTGVEVNGVAATSDDGFRTWRAEVPLADGANALVVEARDAAGKSATAAGAIERIGPVFVSPTGMALDALRNRLLVGDRGDLIAVDLATGARTRLALDGTITAEPRRIVVDEAGRFAYVSGPSAIHRVDLDTGKALVLTGSGFGAGQPLIGIEGIRLEAGTGVLLASDTGGGVVRVDLTTGNRFLLPGVGIRGTRDFVVDAAGRLLTGTRFLTAWDLITLESTTVSSPTLGAGPDPLDLGLFAPQGMAIDAANGLAYLVDDATGIVLEWDLGSGDRRVLSGPASAGPELIKPKALVFDGARDRLLVADAGLDAVVAVDRATGARSIASGAAVGAGPSLFGARDLAAAPDGRLFLLNDDACVVVVDGDARTAVPAPGGVRLFDARSLAFDAAAGRLLLGDAGGSVVEFNPVTQRFENVFGDPTLFSVDPASGDAVVVSGPGSGNGPMFVGVERLAVDGGAALVLDPASKAVFRVDLAAGDRAVLSNRLVGAGAEFVAPNALDVDPVRTDVIVNDASAGVFRVEPATGDRAELATTRLTANDLAVDAAGRRAFLVTATFVVRLELDTATRTSLGGSGPPITELRAAVYDASRGMLVAVDRGTASIVGISPSTGERVILVK